MDQKKIQGVIISKMPHQLKLDFSLWTRKAVKEQVERELGVSLANNTTDDYLRNWGLFTTATQEKRL